METIGNMLGDQEITWDATAKLKLTKINTVQSNIIYKSCKYLTECSMYIKTCMQIFQEIGYALRPQCGLSQGGGLTQARGVHCMNKVSPNTYFDGPDTSHQENSNFLNGLIHLSGFKNS